MKTLVIALLLTPLSLALLPAAMAHPGASAAIDHFNHQIEHNPQDQALHIQRGIAYSSDGQYDKALADLERAKRLGNPLAVKFDLGVLHYRRGELKTAKVYFDEYLAAFPNHSACLEYRARLLRDMGDRDGAVKDFLRVFELQKNPNPGHYISVADMLEASGDGGHERALAALDSGIEKLGLAPQLQQYAIRLELARNRTDLAIQRQQTLEPALGKSPDWKVEMAELLLQNNQQDLARTLLKEASIQLDTLRKTPARQALRERIALLEASA